MEAEVGALATALEMTVLSDDDGLSLDDGLSDEPDADAEAGK